MTGCRENPGGVLLEQQQRQTKGPRAGESVHDPKHCIVVLKLTPKAMAFIWGVWIAYLSEILRIKPIPNMVFLKKTEKLTHQISLH